MCVDKKISARKIGRKWLIPVAQDATTHVVGVNKKELEKIERIKSALKFFRNVLNNWIYHYACTLSGRFCNYLYSGHVLYGQEFKRDMCSLEDIFLIPVWKDGLPIRGTGADLNEIINYSISAQDLRNSLTYGLRQASRIEERLRQYPALPNEVSEQASRIVHISTWIKTQMAELDKWEGECKRRIEDTESIGTSSKNIAIRNNLANLGKRILDTLIAIDAELVRYESIKP